MKEEFLRINHIDVGFANFSTEGTIYSDPKALSSEVTVRKGKLHINLLSPALMIDEKFHNSMNSFVFTQHESPEEQAAERFGGEPSEWMVLLNIESIRQFSFWDAGTLSYCIHKKDLAIADFSRIHTSIESS